MHLSSLLIFITLSLSSIGQATDPFQKLKFDKVVIYDYESGRQENLIVDKNQQLIKSIKKQVELLKPTIDSLNNRLTNKESYGNITAMCFNPHLGIIYYLKDKIVAHISVCLDCNVLRSSIDIPAQKQGEAGEGNSAYYTADGLSKSFRQFLNDLLKRH